VGEKKEEEVLKRAVADVAGTEAGRVVLRWLMNYCAFGSDSVHISPRTGEVDPLGTVVNSAVRRPYLRLRAMVPAENLREIEIPLNVVADVAKSQEEKK
jgi:hypothetical protein